MNGDRIREDIENVLTFFQLGGRQVEAAIRNKPFRIQDATLIPCIGKGEVKRALAYAFLPGPRAVRIAGNPEILPGSAGPVACGCPKPAIKKKNGLGARPPTRVPNNKKLQFFTSSPMLPPFSK